MLSIHDNKVLLEHYKKILFVSSNRVRVLVDALEIEFIGKHIHVLALEKEELLMEGTWLQVVFQHVE